MYSFKQRYNNKSFFLNEMNEQRKEMNIEQTET